MDEMSFERKFYKNRELSWLQFEERILNEAREEDNPLFERLKFLSITASNLDEFFMIRVATLKDMVHAGYTEPDISGLTATKQIDAVSEAAHAFVKKQYEVLNLEILPKLLKAGVELVRSYDELDEGLKKEADRYFDRKIFPVLTPVVIDSSRPFPLIRNNFLNVGGFIGDGNKDKLSFAMIQVPSGIDRVISFKASSGRLVCILLEDLIKSKFTHVFSKPFSKDVTVFRLIRNADLSLVEASASDLISKIEKQMEKREWGEPVRLEICSGNHDGLKERLLCELNLSDRDLYILDGPCDLTFLSEIYDFKGFENLKHQPYVPVMPWEFDASRSLFDQIKEHDLMLIHPFESFKPVIDFINEAATDKDVLAIKQTLYRVSGDSPIVKALAKAAENGKQVTVLVELKARFDEENNIGWARLLEQAGAQVIYGFEKIKTHCKLTLVVRKENDGIKQYVHLGTGNYNDTTAKVYTDVSFFTAKDDFGEDANKVFNMLTGFREPEGFKKLSLAPKGLRSKFLELIEREADLAYEGKPAHIIAKVNSLCDKEIIDALYKASGKGLKIDLIVRGICSLRPGIEGLSENITVRSIVGNFLEHSRIFYFKNGGKPEYYCSSADWMPRNMDKRIEILFPVERKRLQEKLNHVLRMMLKDNTKAWILQADGSYKRMPEEESLFCFQEAYCEEETESENISQEEKK